MSKSPIGSALMRLFCLLAFALCFSGLAHAQQRPVLSLQAQPPAVEGAPANFRVTLSSPATQRLTFSFGTFSGNGPTGALEAPFGAFDADYDGVSTNTDYTLDEGATTLNISVPTFSDTSYEFDENFNAFITNPRYGSGPARNVQIGVGQVSQLILNDDTPPNVTLVTPAPILEGDLGNRQRQNYNFTVNIGSTQADSNREVLGRPITLAFTTTDGSATSIGPAPGDRDFEPASTPGPNNPNPNPVTVPAGTRQFQYTLIVLGDDLYEGDESFTLRVDYSPPLANATGSTVIGVIRDNDLPTYRIDPNDPASRQTVEEGSPVVFVINLFDRQGNLVPALQDITFNYVVQNGTALFGTDFTDTNNGRFIIRRGQTSFRLSFPTIDDNVIEQAETFSFIIRDALGTRAPEGNNSNVGTGTIIDTADNNAGTVFTIQNKSVVEGTNEPNTIEFTVNLTKATTQTATVGFETLDGTARAGTDYTRTRGTLVFSPGSTTGTISVPIVTDAINELDETFRIRLFNPVNAAFANNVENIFATATIIDDDSAGVITMARGDLALREDRGVYNLIVNFTPNPGAQQARPVTVDFATIPDTAVEQGRRDYFGKTGTLTFRPGVTQQVIPIEIVDDGLAENDENFTVRLSNPISATLGAPSDTQITIRDNDDVPVIGVSPVTTVGEGDGTRDFVVSIGGRSQAPVTVNYAFVDGTATRGVDYTGDPGSLTFELGGPKSFVVTANILEDRIVEENETFTFQLSKADGDNSFTLSPANTSAVAKIVDNDGVSELTIGDARVVEGNAPTQTEDGEQVFPELVFPVTISRVNSRPVTFSYSTFNNRQSDCLPENGCESATNPDYEVARRIPVTIPAGDLSAEIRVQVVPDTLNEYNEQIAVIANNLVNTAPSSYRDPNNRTPRTGIIAYGTIVNDDAGGNITVSGPTNAAGDALPNIAERYRRIRGQRGGGLAFFTVTLPAPTGRLLNVAYTLNEGTANEKDYADLTRTARRGQLTFGPGLSTATIAVRALGDNLAEGPENVRVTLGVNDRNGANSYTARGADARAEVTIDDRTPQVNSFTPRVGFAPYGTVAATRVIIQGERLRTDDNPRVAAVIFGGYESTDITYLTDDSIEVGVPEFAKTGPLSLRIVDGSIITSQGRTANPDPTLGRELPNFLVQATVESLTPNTGVPGSSTIVVRGNNYQDKMNPPIAVQFTGGVRVPIGDTKDLAATTRLVNRVRIDVAVPVGAQSGPINIITRDEDRSNDGTDGKPVRVVENVGPDSLENFNVINATGGSIRLGDDPDRNAILEGSTGTFTRPVRNFNGTGDNAFHRPYQFFLDPARQSGGGGDGTALQVTPLTVTFDVIASAQGDTGTAPQIAVRYEANGNGRFITTGNASSVAVDLDENFDPTNPIEVAIVNAGTDDVAPIVGGSPANVTVRARITSSSSTTLFPLTPANQIPTVRVDRIEQTNTANQTRIAFAANSRVSFSVPFSDGNTDSVPLSSVFDGPTSRYTVYRFKAAQQQNKVSNGEQGADFEVVPPNGRLQRGVGYRLVVENSTVQLKTRDAALVVSDAETFNYSLTRNVAFANSTNNLGNSTNGYNLVGFPFNPDLFQSVDFNQGTVTFEGAERSVPDAISAGLIDERLFTINADGTLVEATTTVIQPFQAYFVQVFRDNLTLTLQNPVKK